MPQWGKSEPRKQWHDFLVVVKQSDKTIESYIILYYSKAFALTLHIITLFPKRAKTPRNGRLRKKWEITSTKTLRNTFLGEHRHTAIWVLKFKKYLLRIFNL